MSKKNKAITAVKALPLFVVDFTDKKSRFGKSYTISSQDETTAWQWVEKQRDAWIKTFRIGEQEISDPKGWKVTIAQI